jgi:hypothetical protein
MSASPRLVATVRHLLREGRANAQTGADLLAQVRVLDLDVRQDCVRRIQEAIQALIEEGVPVCSRSSEGYYLAGTAEEIEDALRETEKRARMTLRRRRLLRRALLEKRGQTPIQEAA